MTFNLTKIFNRGREPFFVFLVLGFFIFIVAALRSGDGQTQVIEITEGDVQSLIDQWTSQNDTPPSDEELQGLVAAYIQDEVFFREAQRIGLDQSDVIIRRRLIQKMTFLMSDQGGGAEVTDSALRSFYQENIQEYEIPPRWSFEHRYFSADSRENAEADARRAILNNAETGDPFFLRAAYAQKTQKQLAREFGPSFAEGLAALPRALETWQGPVPSSYGWHNVRVTAYLPAQQLTFEEARRDVLEDYQLDIAAKNNKAQIEKLLNRYDVRMP